MRGREGGSVGGAHGAGVHTPQKNAHGIGSAMSAGACTQQECAGKKDRTTRTTQFGGGAPNKERRNIV